MLREGIDVARCTIERLMKKLEIQGTRRGRKCWTTVADGFALPANRQDQPAIYDTTRLNQLRVAGITFVATWTGFVYVAFIPDVFARYIVGCRISRSLHTDLVLSALEQALWRFGRKLPD